MKRLLCARHSSPCISSWTHTQLMSRGSYNSHFADEDIEASPMSQLKSIRVGGCALATLLWNSPMPTSKLCHTGKDKGGVLCRKEVIKKEGILSLGKVRLRKSSVTRFVSMTHGSES